MMMNVPPNFTIVLCIGNCLFTYSISLSCIFFVGSIEEAKRGALMFGNQDNNLFSFASLAQTTDVKAFSEGKWM